MSKLSIIIPCYNCQDTLEEALASVYTQELKIPFEVVLVDDGSTDGTRELISQLTQKYEGVKYFFHEKNQGGGATRNTAVSKTTGDIIFCLDSDDLLPPNTLPKMLKLLEEKNCDGIVFAENRFFEGNNKDKTETVKNVADENRPLKLADIFTDKGFFTQVNFLYTKEAFSKIGGYPTNHGFDTQGFGLDFLGKKLIAYLCPGTYYLSRRGTKKKSYFERVYEAGDFSKNIYLIMENIFPAFSNKTKLATINYDIFQRTTGKDNLDVELKNLYQNDPALFFAKEESLAIDDDRVENLFTLAISLFKQKKYTEAIDVYQKIVERGTNSPITYFNILRNLVGLSGHFAENQIEKEAQSLITRMSPAKQRRFTRYPRLIRLIKFLGLKNVTKKILALLTNSPV